MSIMEGAKMSTLKDKIREQAKEVEVKNEVEEVEEVEVKKGRRLNK
jgi:thioredoxin reductase